MKRVCSGNLQWHGFCQLRFSLYCLVLISIAFLPCTLLASNEYCAIEKKRHHLDLAYAVLKKSKMDKVADNKVAITHSEVRFDRLVSNQPGHAISLGFNELYTIMDFDQLSSMTNGHLHTLGLSLNGHYQKNGMDILYNLNPVISVSSNALKNTHLLNSESFQLTSSLIATKVTQSESDWVFGFKSDYRFGDYRLYPLAGVCWRYSDNWLFQFALPDFSIQKLYAGGIKLILYATAEGNKWHVFSQDVQRDSVLTYNDRVAGITAQWFITPTIELSLDVERHTNREFRLVLSDNSLIEPRAASSTEIRLSGRILF